MDLVMEILTPPGTLNYDVRDKLLRCISDWACFEESQELPGVIGDTKRRLSALGVEFPEPNPHAVTAARAFTETLVAPEWTDGPVCTRCRSEFTTFLRKHHCRNCGRVFCYRCSSKTASLPWYGMGQDVRVCDGCYTRKGPYKVTASKMLPPRPSREDEDIKRAISLSLEPAPEPEDPDLAAAIEASLRDMEIAKTETQTPYAQPLITHTPFSHQARAAYDPSLTTFQPAPQDIAQPCAPLVSAPPVPPRPPLELDTQDIDNVLTFAQTVSHDAPWRQTSADVPKPVQNMYERAAASRVTVARTFDQGNRRLHTLTSMHDKISEAVRLYDRLLDVQMSNMTSAYTPPRPAPSPTAIYQPSASPVELPLVAAQPDTMSDQPSAEQTASLVQSPITKPRCSALDLLSEIPSAPPVTTVPQQSQQASAPSEPQLSAQPAPSAPLIQSSPVVQANSMSLDTTGTDAMQLPKLPSAPTMPVMPAAPTREPEPEALIEF